MHEDQIIKLDSWNAIYHIVLLQVCNSQAHNYHIILSNYKWKVDLRLNICLEWDSSIHVRVALSESILFLLFPCWCQAHTLLPSTYCVNLLTVASDETWNYSNIYNEDTMVMYARLTDRIPTKKNLLGIRKHVLVPSISSWNVQPSHHPFALTHNCLSICTQQQAVRWQKKSRWLLQYISR